MLKRSHNERCSILGLRSCIIYIFFRKCDNLKMCHLHSKFHKPTVSLLFINTHRTPTESYVHHSHSSYPWKKMKWIQSLLYMCWILSPWNDIWRVFAYYCSYTNVHCIMSINTMQHCPKLFLFMLFTIFKQFILI